MNGGSGYPVKLMKLKSFLTGQRLLGVGDAKKVATWSAQIESGLSDVPEDLRNLEVYLKLFYGLIYY